MHHDGLGQLRELPCFCAESAYMVNCTTFHRQDGPVKDEKFGDRASFRYNRAMDAEVELDIHT